MKKTLFLVLLSIMVISCGEPTINGKIMDNFNKPISDLEVSIKGTSLKTNTNSNGEYSINFVPGSDIKINFSKENYLNSEITVNIATKDDFPAETVNTYKIPSEKGVFLVGKEDYINIPKVNVKSERVNFLKNIRMSTDGGFAWTGPCTFEGYNYFAELKENDIPTVKSGEINFANTLEKSMTLVNLRKSNNKFRIAKIYYPTKAKFDRGRSYGYAHYTWESNSSIFKRNMRKELDIYSISFENLQKDNNEQKFALAKRKLDKGYYAFCKTSGSSKKAIETEYVLAFKVE